jgi:lipopolysaccharide/colanic/teichoic acid biosynthesis glycosyltransferase
LLQHGSSTSPRGPIDAPGLLGAADGAGAVRPVPGLFGAPVPLDYGERPGAARHALRHGDVVPAERSELANRVLNVLVAGLALLILAPVCVLVALLVKLTSPGPVFYTQTRVGLDRRWRRAPGAVAGGSEPADDDDRRLEDLGGQPFTILKFRSMRADAEAGGQAVWATKHDPRITPVGRILRKTRLDEVPQLINVLRGEMNIVGPRPERPSIVVRLREHVGEYPVRHRVKPGITGWAQINHSYDASIEDVRTKVRYDLEYLRRQGVLFDLKIMVLTVPVMVFKRGAH